MSGEGGIRTPDTLADIPVFETGAFGHSATSPDRDCPRFLRTRYSSSVGLKPGADTSAAVFVDKDTRAVTSGCQRHLPRLVG